MTSFNITCRLQLLFENSIKGKFPTDLFHLFLASVIQFTYCLANNERPGPNPTIFTLLKTCQKLVEHTKILKIADYLNYPTIPLDITKLQELELCGPAQVN